MEQMERLQELSRQYRLCKDKEMADYIHQEYVWTEREMFYSLGIDMALMPMINESVLN